MMASDELFRALERELFAAHEGSPDLATIERLYADDFLSTNADGRVVDKQGWLDILKAGQFPVDKITADDFKVRTYSSTAIVTGRSAYHYAGQKLAEVRHTQCGRTRTVAGGWSAGRGRPSHTALDTSLRRSRYTAASHAAIPTNSTFSASPSLA